MADPPFLVVSEQSEQEIRRRKARGALAGELRAFAVNFLRVMRGGGKPWQLLREFEACAAAIRAYAAEHDSLPDAHTMYAALDWDAAWHEARPWIKENEAELAEANICRDPASDLIEDAIETIVRGALQVIASKFANQSTQYSAGRSEIQQGIREREQAIERRKSNYTRKTPKESLEEAWRAVEVLKGLGKSRRARKAHLSLQPDPFSGSVQNRKTTTHILRKSDGTPLVIGRKKKKPPGDEPGGQS